MSYKVSLRRSSSRSECAVRCLLGVVLALSLGGCSTVSYYAQAVRGQLDVVAASRPVDDVLADDATGPGVRERLTRLAELRHFAVEELHLADSGSYRDYADLDREAMVWSVVATPWDSLVPRQWCYPVIGCASYRGYFDRAAAEGYARDLTDAGWDVAVEPVPAYSTLGWFDDPLPSTVIHWPLADIAALLFHELAHETLYVADDSAFNEAYATLVEREGVRRWLQRFGTEQARHARLLHEQRRVDFLRLLDGTRLRLQLLYDGGAEPVELAARKQVIIAELQRDYLDQKAEWDGYSGYDRWFGRPLNNAHFASVSTYNALLPALERLLHKAGGDLSRFHAECRELADLSVEERHARLQALLTPSA